MMTTTARRLQACTANWQFPPSCVMFRGVQAETCLCVCSYTMSPLWAHAWYVVTPLPPCHRVALKLWFLLLPPAFYSRPPMGFFFLWSSGAREVLRWHLCFTSFFFFVFFYQVAWLFHVRRWHLFLAEYLEENLGCSHISELNMRGYLRVILFRKCSLYFFFFFFFADAAIRHKFRKEMTLRLFDVALSTKCCFRFTKSVPAASHLAMYESGLSTCVFIWTTKLTRGNCRLFSSRTCHRQNSAHMY